MTRTMTLMIAGLVSACAAPVTPQAARPVFFTAWSAQFDEGSKAVVEQVASEMKAAPRRSLTIIGSADPVGSPEANHDISRLRTQVVYDTLVANGVSPERMHRQARGATEFVLMPQESRRVDLVLSD